MPNIDETLSKLKTLVDRDVSDGLLPKDDQIHERYQYLLRQIWEEDIASRRHTLSQHPLTNKDCESDASNSGQPQTSNTDQVLPTGPNNYSTPLEIFDTGQSNVGSNLLEGCQPLELMSTFEPLGPSMNAPMADVFNLIQRHIQSHNQDFTYSHSTPQLSQRNNYVTEGFLDTFSETDLPTGAPDSIELSGIPLPEADTSQMATTEATVLSDTSMIPAITERRNSVHIPIGLGNQGSASSHQSQQFSDVALAEDILDVFWGCDFDAEASHTLERLDSPLLEAQDDQIPAAESSGPSQEFTFDYNQGADQMVSFLDTENEMTEARGPWKDSNSGNAFLRHRG